MLTISRTQLDQFDRSVAAKFMAEMEDHVRAFSPALAKTLGDEGVARFTRAGVARAQHYGFTKRGPIRSVLELSMIHGSYFDTDPQHRPLAEILRSGDEEMARAEQMFARTKAYASAVPDEAVVAAIGRLTEMTAPPSRSAFPTEFDCMYATFTDVFPEKMTFIGRMAFGRLSFRAKGVTHRLGAQTRESEWTVLALMLFFGHGCLSDPLYPWISHMLSQPGTVGPDDRIRLIGQKARRWGEAILARTDEGEAL